jgi:hypothetical protein
MRVKILRPLVLRQPGAEIGTSDSLNTVHEAIFRTRKPPHQPERTGKK